jgi:hypothetical protein
MLALHAPEGLGLEALRSRRGSARATLARVAVRAIDRRSNVDPTPAARGWKVKRKRQRE